MPIDYHRFAEVPYGGVHLFNHRRDAVVNALVDRTSLDVFVQRVEVTQPVDRLLGPAPGHQRAIAQVTDRHMRRVAIYLLLGNRADRLAIEFTQWQISVLAGLGAPARIGQRELLRCEVEEQGSEIELNRRAREEVVLIGLFPLVTPPGIHVQLQAGAVFEKETEPEIAAKFALVKV